MSRFLKTHKRNFGASVDNRPGATYVSYWLYIYFDFNFANFYYHNFRLHYFPFFLLLSFELLIIIDLCYNLLDDKVGSAKATLGLGTTSFQPTLLIFQQ
jgi:hypothetical protein